MNPGRAAYHADGLAGSHVVVVGVPPLEFWVLSVLQDVLLALEVGMVKADKGAALHAHRVDPVHEAAVLEVVTVAADLQLPPSETFSLIEHDLYF